MIHYHGTPITPETAAVRVLSGGHAFVSFQEPRNLGVAIEVCQSFAIDNGAFTAWKQGAPIRDWRPFYEWAAQCRRIPSCDFAVIPDVIDGDEAANDALLAEWPLPRWFGAPVWHMHESLERLERLAATWPRVCVGSSGDYSRPGSGPWWARMADAMRVVCNDEGEPLVKLHGLRMLSSELFGRLPLASADSTNVARNIGIDQRWTGSYSPATKEARADVLRGRIENVNAPRRWDGVIPQTDDQAQGMLL